MVYTLYYFPIRGRAEFARLVAEAGGVEYKNELVAGEAWGKLKPSAPFGQMPFVEGDNGFKLGQSVSIARFFAREGKLIPADSREAAIADSIVDSAQDVKNAFARAFYSQNKEEETKKVLEGTFPNILTKLDALVKSNADSSFAVGKSLSWADIAVFELVESVLDNGVSVDAYPAVKKLYETVLENDKIKKYVASPTRPQPMK